MSNSLLFQLKCELKRYIIRKLIFHSSVTSAVEYKLPHVTLFILPFVGMLITCGTEANLGSVFSPLTHLTPSYPCDFLPKP